MERLTKRSAALGVLLAVASCASFGTFASSPDKAVAYGSEAEQNIALGNEALESKNFPDAQKYFEYVRSKFPFVEAAKTAELRLADTEFDREQFTTAREKYQNFVRLHPTHPKVEYAAFRAALTHFKDIPSDFFVLPPSFEKDQIEVRSALAAMNEFLSNYGKSEYAAEANKVRDDVRKRLALHELAVADFYKRREKWAAVASRLTQIEKYYAGIGYDERVAFGLFESYTQLKRPDDAKAALARFADKNPEAPAAKKARQMLGQP